MNFFLQLVALRRQRCNVLLLGFMPNLECTILALESPNVVDSVELIEMLSVRAERVHGMSPLGDIVCDAFADRGRGGPVY